MAAILFLIGLIIALVHVFGGHLLDKHYLDWLFVFLFAGLLFLALGWTGFPGGFTVARKSTA